DAFHREVMTSERYHKIHLLLDLAANPESTRGVNPDPAELTEALAILADVNAACTGKFAGVRNTGPHVREPGFNAEAWCRATPDREALGRRGAQNAALETLGIVMREIDKMAGDLERNEGWLRIDETLIHRALFDRDGLAKELATRHAKLFAAAGVTGGP